MEMSVSQERFSSHVGFRPKSEELSGENGHSPVLASSAAVSLPRAGSAHWPSCCAGLWVRHADVTSATESTRIGS